MKINLVMIVKNEERTLERCLKAAKPLVDDIIIADTGSADRTVEIARQMGAAVYPFTWVNDFSAARNFALEKSDGDWNLVLDADETVRWGSGAAAGAVSLQEASDRRRGLERILADGARTRRGKWLGGITIYDAFLDEEDGISVSVSVLPRLLPRGMRYTGAIHEQPEGDHPCCCIPIEIDHDGYLQEGKGERNLTYLEQAAADHPGDSYYHFQLASTLRNLKRLEESLVPFRDFYRLTKPGDGYRAGGIVLYLYTLLDIGTSACLDEAGKIVEKEGAALGGWSDFCFVCGLFYMKRVLSDVERYIGLLPNIEKCYQRCLELGECPEKGGVVGTGSFKAAYNLGAWYEVSGQMELAVRYYRMAAEEGYGKAAERLKMLKI